MRRVRLVLGLLLLSACVLSGQGVPPPVGAGINWLQGITEEVTKLIAAQGDALIPLAEWS